MSNHKGMKIIDQNLHTTGDVSVGGSMMPLKVNWDAPAAPGTTNQTITIAEILTGILQDDPEGAGTWTLPTAALAVGGVANVKVGDCIDFAVINESDGNEIITMAAGSGGSLVGKAEVEAKVGADATEQNAGSGLFRIRFTGVESSSESYVCYRLA